jgi:hypothetical protein
MVFHASLLVALVAGAQVTPIEKVVTLLKDLSAQVNEEGHAEATSYDEFACFCKSKTDEKTTAISEAETAVDGLVADLGTYTADRDQLDLDISTLNEDILTFEQQLKDAEAMRKEEKNTFALAFEDMTKAVQSLEGAIDTLKASETVSMMTVKSIVHKSIVMADALGFLDTTARKNKVVTALLAQSPTFEETFGDTAENVPTTQYDFHSGDIMTTLESLLGTFRTKKEELESDDVAAEEAYTTARQAKITQMETAQTTLANKQEERSTKVKDIAIAQGDLTERNAVLNDDRMYLKDLAAKCEIKAKEWDQRSSMRAQELAAITQALSVLEGQVADQLNATGDRALMQQEVDDDDDFDDDSVAFVQVAVASLVRPSKPVDAVGEKKVALVTQLLTKMGKKLKSPVLSSLALKVKEDPFVKVKALIQGLIERLLQEEADEANHKGWCDTEIAKTLKDRDYRLRDVKELQIKLEGLNARNGTLSEEISELTIGIATLTSDLANQTAARDAEKTAHETTIDDAKEGLTAINDAIDILSHFYGTAANAGLIQKKVAKQPGSVESEAPDTGFEGNYTGSQGASTGILGLMDVIKGDFSRTVSETTAAEEEAKRDFVDFERDTKMSITTKTTAKESLEHEKTEVEGELSTSEEGIRTQQELLDTAVEQWEKLLPGCVADPGMSAEERVAKREEEVAALKDAYCILNDEEPGCGGVFLQTQKEFLSRA